MDLLLNASLKEKMPIEIMYMAKDNSITKRKIVVTGLEKTYIKAFCFVRNQKRTFKRENILAVAKPKKRRERYA